MRALETGMRARADFVTCVSPAEQAFFRSTEGTAPVALVPLSLRDVRFTERRHEERSGIAFVAGWLGGSDSPNGDSLTWFMSHVMPLVTQSLPACRLTVTGDCPPELMERFRRMGGVSRTRAEPGQCSTSESAWPWCRRDMAPA